MANENEIRVVSFPDGNFMSLPSQLLNWLRLNRAAREYPNEFSPPGIVENVIRFEVASFLEERPDEHFSIYPIWTSSAEVFISEWRYLKILVWDQQFFQYVAGIFFSLFFENNDLGKKHIQGWLVTYVSERLMNRNPILSRYYYESNKNLFPLSSDDTTFSEALSIKEFGVMCEFFRKFVLHHELGHMKLLAEGDFREIMQTNYAAISKITQEIIETNTKLYVSEIKKYSAHTKIINLDEDHRQLTDITPLKRDEVFCDIYAIFYMLNGLLSYNRPDFPKYAALLTTSIIIHLQILYELQQSWIRFSNDKSNRLTKEETFSVENFISSSLRDTHLRQKFVQATVLAYLSHKAEDMVQEFTRITNSYLSILTPRAQARLHSASFLIPSLSSQDEATQAISGDAATVLSDFKLLLGWG